MKAAGLNWKNKFNFSKQHRNQLQITKAIMVKGKNVQLKKTSSCFLQSLLKLKTNKIIERGITEEKQISKSKSLTQFCQLAEGIKQKEIQFKMLLRDSNINNLNVNRESMNSSTVKHSMTTRPSLMASCCENQDESHKQQIKNYDRIKFDNYHSDINSKWLNFRQTQSFHGSSSCASSISQLDNSFNTSCFLANNTQNLQKIKR